MSTFDIIAAVALAAVLIYEIALLIADAISRLRRNRFQRRAQQDRIPRRRR